MWYCTFCLSFLSIQYVSHYVCVCVRVCPCHMWLQLSLNTVHQAEGHESLTYSTHLSSTVYIFNTGSRVTVFLRLLFISCVLWLIAEEKRRSVADFRDSEFLFGREKSSVSVKAMSALYQSKAAAVETSGNQKQVG